MIRTKKIAILAIIAMVLTLMPAAMFAATDNRLAGADRISTAIAIADEGWTTAGTVVLAPADQANLVDALAAAPLAGKTSPILLTFKGALNADVKAKIAALGATKVYVVGAISDAVVAEVDAMSGVTAEKLSGANRWATADAINAKLTSPAGSFVVGYNATADALSVASYAAANNYAIVLTKADGTVDASKLVGSKTYLVGGTAVVKDYAGATRLSGADRFATNKAVAEGLTFQYSSVYVANGLSMVDALAVAPLAAKANAFVALASASDVAATGAINANLTSASKVIAVGGVNAVSDAVKGLVAYITPSTFAVTGVETNGRQQFTVNFSKEADKTTAEDEANYVLGGASLTAANANAVLSSDKMSVVVYLNGVEQQNAKKAFKVKSAVFSKDMLEKNATFNADITFVDITVPTVASVKASGNKRVDVTFSEPVDIPAGYTTWKIDGQTISNFGFTAPVTTTGTQDGVYADVYKLDFGVAIPTGSHTLTIPAGVVGSSLADAAGFKLAETSVDFTVDSVTGAPSIVSVEASDNGAIYVTYDRKMGASATTAGNYKINDAAIATAGFKADTGDKVVKLTVASLPIGANTILLDYKIADNYGNKLGSSSSDDIRMAFTAVKDTVKPTVTSVVMTTPTTTVVKFSESVNSAFATNAANYTLKNSSGVKQTVTVASTNSSTYTLTHAALSGTNYTLKIENITDLAATPNEMDDYITTISGIDEVNPTVLKVYSQTSLQKVAVYYDESVQTTTVSNYSYTDNGTTVRALPSGATVDVGETAKIAIITFPTSFTTNLGAGIDNQYMVASITATNVKDLAGNTLNGVSQTVAVTAPAGDAANGPKYAADSFNLFADSSKVWAEFETTQTITTLAISDFVVNGLTAAGGAVAVAPDTGYVVGKKVVLNFTNATKMADIKRAGIAATLDDAALVSTNSLGVPLVTFAAATVEDDQIAPAVLGVTTASASKIEVQFSETIDDTILGLYTDDFVVTSNGQERTVSSVTVKAGTAITKDTLELNLSAALVGAYTVKANNDATKMNIRDLKDAAKNYNAYVPKTSEKSTGFSVADTFGPVLTSVTFADNATVSANTFDADDTITFVFGEALLATSINAGLTAGGSITDTVVNLFGMMGAFATPMVLAPATDAATSTLALSADGKTVTITTVGAAGAPGTPPSGAFTPLGTITDAAAQAVTGTPVAGGTF